MGTLLWVITWFSLSAFKILSLTFVILIMMCLRVDLFASILFGTLYGSWTCMSISFTKLGKFSFIVFSHRFPISCSFSSPGTQWCEDWNVWSCPRGSLHYPQFFGFFFLLAVLIGCLSLPHVPNHWFDSWLHPLYCCFPVNCSLF